MNRGGHPQAAHMIMIGVCLTIQGILTTAFLSYIILTSFDITNGRNIDLLGGDSDNNSLWQNEDYDQQTISP